MSHVAIIDIVIKDLDALEAAAKRLGMELVRNQRTFQWFGISVGDYAAAADAAEKHGIAQEDFGKCDHAIRIPGAVDAYEIGVLKGPAGYRMIWDHWDSRLRKTVGDGAGKLLQAYAIECATREARRNGYTVTERALPNGSIKLQIQVG